MFCMPPATIMSAVPDMIACAPKEIACWLEPHCRSTVTPGNLLWETRCQPGQSGDVARLSADGVHAARDHVGDGARIDVVAVEEPAPRRRPEVDGVQAGQAAVAFADGGTYGIDDVTPQPWSFSFVVIPPRTMARYCLPTSSAVRGPPGWYQRTDTQVVSRMNR